ncbi:MAG: hypothetical protein QG673_70 [Pseudomonadota bacterium]|nr:hypothetical protein [Pseudomonadota bacterium]
MLKNKPALFIKMNFICMPMALLLSSCNNGSTTPSTQQIQYTTINYPNAGIGSTTGISGIRQVANSSDVYIAGSYYESGSTNMGTLYKGPILGGGTYYIYNYPSSTGATTNGTTVYSADNSSISGNVQLVGTYTTQESGTGTAFGFFYNGPIPSESSAWQSINFPSSQTPGQVTVKNTYPHSIMNGIVVGNYDADLIAGNAFIYNVNTESYTTLVKLGSVFTSAYGVWWNGGTSYTIAGGYSDESTTQLTNAYIVDYDSSTGALTNWVTYNYNNKPGSILTHFQGITTDGAGGYNLAAGWENNGILGASFVNVKRTASGSLSAVATWIDLVYPGSSTTTANTVYQNYCLGIYNQPGIDQTNAYVATIPVSWYIYPYYQPN